MLSVSDLNLSTRIEEMAEAGVTSFKIEGRLKDMTYLKNTVVQYRITLDELINRNSKYCRASDGETIRDFVPAPCKSFSRGFTEYYFSNPQNRVGSLDTPKSIGEYIGKITGTGKDWFETDGRITLSNGDGICYTDADGNPGGTNINRVEGKRIFPNRIQQLTIGTEIYRNYDHRFTTELEHSKTRTVIPVEARLLITETKLTLAVTDRKGNQVETSTEGVFDRAKNPAKAEETIRTQLAKTGDTIFRTDMIEVDWTGPFFVPASVVNSIRRKALDELDRQRLTKYIRETGGIDKRSKTVYPSDRIDFTGNVINRLAERFYRRHGVLSIEPGFELKDNPKGLSVMRTKYCLRREIGICQKKDARSFASPLRLIGKNHTFELRFHCDRCEMSVVYIGKIHRSSPVKTRKK